MKKGLILCLALVMALAMVANAVKIDKKATMMTKNGESTAIKATTSKGVVPTFATLVGVTNYADAWRGTSAQYGKSIIVDPTGTSIGIVFGTKSGSLCDMLFGYSLDGGANWATQTMASNMNVRIYNGAALDASGQPYIVWQDRTNNSIQWAKDEGGIGAGLWTSPDTLCRDTVAWYLPSMAIGGNKMAMSAFAHGAAAPLGDFSIHAVMSNDLGATWMAPWDRLPLPDGWNKFTYNEISGQGWDLDDIDWIFSPSGDTVIALLEEVTDTMAYIAGGGYSGFWPVIKVSYDGGVTWSAQQQIFGVVPQYNGGGWWYRYDGAWIGDRPHIVFGCADDVWNGVALFELHPTNAGDFSAWTATRISDVPTTVAGVVPGDLNGSLADHPTISYDASGNIFAIYEDYRKDLKDKQEIFGVASTDGGATWLNPVMLTNDTAWSTTPGGTATIYNEAAENVANDRIHMLLHAVDYTNIYYWSVPTSTILAGGVRPAEITLSPELCNAGAGGWGGPIDATMDTVSGDTLSTIWAPKVALGGTYEVQVCTTSNFSSSDKWLYTGVSPMNVNYLQTIGLPYANHVLYWRVRAVENSVYSPWSEVYDFYYNGSTVNTTDWTNLGVAGNPVTPTAHKFSLNQNRPNPVNKVAELSFTLPKSGNYSLKIYNIAGQVIKTLDGKGTAGQNTITWNGMDNGGRKVANGVYLYNLNAFGNSATKKLVVVR